MTRVPAYPPVDPRRVSALRAALLRDIAALAPDWRAAQEAEGPDRALVEVAARLSEEATRRLDRTPERDALAFLEMLDIMPLRPNAAGGVAVFVLKQNKTAPVTAGARTGVGIKTLAGETAAFETTEDLRIQPTRIDRVGTVDPQADKLELAPPRMTGFDPQRTPPTLYGLAASAGADATAISITPPVGIEADDLLRVSVEGADPVFLEVAAFSDDGLATLKAPVGGAGLSVDKAPKIERMTWLDAFAMPDRQSHGLYIGDAEVLNVKEPAIITLRFSPAGIAGVLSPNAVVFEIWGTSEGPGTPEAAPRWHRLVPLAGAGLGDLRLMKAWVGPVDETELGGRKSRFLRVRPLAPIVPVNGEHPLTGKNVALDQVRMGIVTEEPEDVGGETVSQIAYNGAPLPLTTSFLPFGPEPRRFDVFSLAAPEAFTKDGATATLRFDLKDATLAALTFSQRVDSERHAYGIGRNGRLQVMALTGDRELWREVDGPPEETGPDVTLPLNPLAGVLAYGWSRALGAAVEARDVVIAVTRTGNIVAARIDIARNALSSNVEVVSWRTMPDLPAGALAEGELPRLAVVPALSGDGVHYTGVLLAVTSGGVFRNEVNQDGEAANENWSAVSGFSGDPLLAPGATLTFVEGSTDPALGSTSGALLALDETGALWVLSVHLNFNFAVWDQLLDKDDNAVLLAPGARPAALRMERGVADRLLVVGRMAGGAQLGLLEFDYGGSFGFVDDLGSGPEIDTGAALRLVRGLSTTPAELPHVLGYQTHPQSGMTFEWAPGSDQVSRHRTAEAMALADPPALASAAIFGPDDEHDSALIAFGAENQALVRLVVNPSAQVSEHNDWVVAPPSTKPDAIDYDQILVERLLSGDLARSVSSETAFAVTAAGDDVIRLDLGATDWLSPVRVFRAKSHEETADFDETLGPGDVGFGTLLGSAGSTSSMVPGQLLLVRPTNAPPRYDFLVVDQTQGGNALTMTDRDALATLMNGHDQATWQEVDEVAGVAPERSAMAEGTLVQIDEVPVEPEDVSLFDAGGFAVAAEVIDTQAQDRTIVTLGWSGTPPQIGDLVKVVASGASAEVLALSALSSDYSAPELSWEYFDGEGWKLLDRQFRDTTADFSRSGSVSFTVPGDLSKVEIGGQEDFWIRVRLVGGDYGKPVYKVKFDPASSTQEVIVDTDSLRPPEVARVTARVALPPKHLPELVVARNNLRDLDQSSANKLSGARFAMFEGAYEVPLGKGGDRAILLGLTGPLEPGSASLFVTVREQPRQGKLVLETLGPDNNWAPAPLSDTDPTRGLHRSGLLRFNVTERPAQVLLFGKALHWLRLTVEGLADWAPEITGIWLNGVAIIQAETVRQELLASSVGEPGLELQLQKPPVLAQSLELRVRERLGEEDIAALEAARVDVGPEPILTDVPNLPGNWVLWRQTNSLHAAGGDDRVYLLNPDGRLRFGDGQNGRIVPAGQDNIRAFSYLSGGQRVETAAFAEVGLTGSVEGVELVLAPAPIAGGTHPPGASDLVARMPDALRHAGYGLSLADIEALARDADSEIVQVRAFAPVVEGGPVRLIVLARGESRAPVYSLAQRDHLRRVLSARMSDAYPALCLDVRSAAFVKVKVTVKLISRPGRKAELESVAGMQLRTFLHAAFGGPEGEGWQPGRGLWATDIRRALGGIDALDSVDEVGIEMPEARALGEVSAEEVITTPSVSDVRILVVGEAET